MELQLPTQKLLQGMESDARYVVVRRCFAGKLEYLGKVESLKDFLEYREICGFDKSDIAFQDWKPKK